MRTPRSLAFTHQKIQLIQFNQACVKATRDHIVSDRRLACESSASPSPSVIFLKSFTKCHGHPSCMAADKERKTKIP